MYKQLLTELISKLDEEQCRRIADYIEDYILMPAGKQIKIMDKKAKIVGYTTVAQQLQQNIDHMANKHQRFLEEFFSMVRQHRAETGEVYTMRQYTIMYAERANLSMSAVQKRLTKNNVTSENFENQLNEKK